MAAVMPDIPSLHPACSYTLNCARKNLACEEGQGIWYILPKASCFVLHDLKIREFILVDAGMRGVTL